MSRINRQTTCTPLPDDTCLPDRQAEVVPPVFETVDNPVFEKVDNPKGGASGSLSAPRARQAGAPSACRTEGCKRSGGNRSTVRGFCLLSGGLDSQLAIAVLRAQGIQVEGIAFDSPFFNIAPARQAARALGIDLRVVDFTDSITALILNPGLGRGANLNPCRDCHAAMIRQAGRLMDAEGADFVATGEVLNQRPMSQTRKALDLVARESGYGEVLVRPLSAQLLPETLPERDGRIDRSRLLALEGRNRKPQMALAGSYGIRDYPSPAGGCRLTEPNYCRRLRDVMAHEGLDDRRPLELLRWGRHFRLPDGRKLVVGRHREDNLALEAAASATDAVLWARDVPGPTALAPDCADADNATLARMLQVVCAYADRDADLPLQCVIRLGNRETIRPEPAERLSRERLRDWLV